MDNHQSLSDCANSKEPEISRLNSIAGHDFGFKAELTRIRRLSGIENLYRVRIINPEERRRFSFKAGQFVMLEVPGIGDAPFSISSSPSGHGEVELCIRAVGNLTKFLTKVEESLRVRVRGPFGTSFPMEAMQGQDVLLIAGGLGLAPLRAPISWVMENRASFGRVDVVYGSKDNSRLLFEYQYEEWRAAGIDLSIIVEKPDAAWRGKVGLLTGALAQLSATREKSFREHTCALVCGPPAMFKFVCDLLTQAGIPAQKIYVSLERRMNCGTGKCCRCNIGATYACLSGPVFDYGTVLKMKDAI